MNLDRFRAWIFGQLGPAVLGSQQSIEEIDAAWLDEHWKEKTKGAFDPRYQYVEVILAGDDAIPDREAIYYRQVAAKEGRELYLDRFVHWVTWASKVGCSWRDGDEIISVKSSAPESVLFEVHEPETEQLDLFSTEGFDQPLVLNRPFGKPRRDLVDEVQQRILGARVVAATSEGVSP